MGKFFNKKLQNIILISLIVILVGVIAAIYIKEKNEKNVVSNENVADLQLNKEQEEPKIEPEKINRFEGLTLINDNRGVPVLYYHSVEPSEKNEVIISPDRLREQLQFIKDSGYTTLTISEFYDYIISKKPIPEKSILITFDDGYMDNYTNAFPILKELEMKATIFVITSVIDEGSYYLSSEKIKEMSDYGIDIESHTATHSHLDQLTYEEQLKELKDSKEKIESITGKEVLSVAYPYGDLNEDSIKAVKEAGYSLAFTTNLGYADREDTPVKLDRIYVSSRYTMERFKNRLINTNK